MYLDVIELRDFYAKPLGVVVRRTLMRKLRSHWQNVSGMNVFGLGYAVPYLGMFRHEAQKVGALMPAGQGVITWPTEGPFLSTLVDECELPLPDSCVDRMLVVHCLEMCEASHDLLREIWRVLTPEGRLILVVPNRRGVWARIEHTPFGHGQPYSRGQLQRRLANALFDPVEWSTTLYMPPVDIRLFLRSSAAFEQVGSRMWPLFSGILIVEASKEIYGGALREGVKVSSARLRPVPAVPFSSSGNLNYK
jgi:SAM-dependent methyltransferase